MSNKEKKFFIGFAAYFLITFLIFKFGLPIDRTAANNNPLENNNLVHYAGRALYFIISAIILFFYFINKKYKSWTGRSYFGDRFRGNIDSSPLRAINDARHFKDDEKQRNRNNIDFKKYNIGNSSPYPTGVVFGINKRNWFVCDKEDNLRNANVLILGAPGTGKSSAYIKTNLLTIRHSNIFGFDFSGDLFSDISVQNMIIFDLEDDHHPVRYDPFAAVDLARDDISVPAEVRHANVIDALSKIAYDLMPILSTDGASGYFERFGRDALTAALICGYNNGLTFIEICDIISSKDDVSLLNWISRNSNKKPEIISLISGFASLSDNNRGGCIQQTKNAVKIFTSVPRIRKSFSLPKKSETAMVINAETIEKQSVFVRVDMVKIDEYSSALSLITNQMFDHLLQRPLDNSNLPTIHCMLDEANSLKINNLPNIVRNVRKRKVRIHYVTQSLPDIDATYDETVRNAVVNSCSWIVTFGINDPKTQQIVADIIGKQFRRSESKSYSTSTQTNFVSREEMDYVIRPEDLRYLHSNQSDDGDRLVLIGPDGYQILHPCYYFKYLTKNNNYQNSFSIY